LRSDVDVEKKTGEGSDASISLMTLLNEIGSGAKGGGLGRQKEENIKKTRVEAEVSLTKKKRKRMRGIDRGFFTYQHAKGFKMLKAK